MSSNVVMVRRNSSIGIKILNGSLYQPPPLLAINRAVSMERKHNEFSTYGLNAPTVAEKDALPPFQKRQIESKLHDGITSQIPIIGLHKSMDARD